MIMQLSILTPVLSLHCVIIWHRYDPDFLDDPDLKTGKHRTVLNLPGFRVLAKAVSFYLFTVQSGIYNTFCESRRLERRVERTV